MATRKWSTLNFRQIINFFFLFLLILKWTSFLSNSESFHSNHYKRKKKLQDIIRLFFVLFCFPVNFRFISFWIPKHANCVNGSFEIVKKRREKKTNRVWESRFMPIEFVSRIWTKKKERSRSFSSDERHLVENGTKRHLNW